MYRCQELLIMLKEYHPYTSICYPSAWAGVGGGQAPLDNLARIAGVPRVWFMGMEKRGLLATEDCNLQLQRLTCNLQLQFAPASATAAARDSCSA
jgi:hypothetical protein